MEKDKIKIMLRKIMMIIMGICVGGFVILVIIGAMVSAFSDKVPKMSEYDKALGLEYRSAMLEQIPLKTLIKIPGRVSQISEFWGRIETKTNYPQQYSGNDVYLKFDKKVRVLENDIIMVYGRYDGVEQYETITHASRTIPRIIVDYYEIIKPSN